MSSHLDFRLTVIGSDHGASYSVTLFDCIADRRVAFEPETSFNRAMLPLNSLAQLRRSAQAKLPDELLLALGLSLGDLLLPQGIKTTLLHEFRRNLGASMSIRLDVRHLDLAPLPWEYLRLDAASDIQPEGWLFLNDRITFRRESAGLKSCAPIHKDKLRVVVASADPATSRYPTLAHLDDEEAAIRGVLEANGILSSQIYLLPSATVASLRNAIRRRKPHLLHFIGHGENSPSGGNLILMGSDSDSAFPLNADTLAEWLTDSPINLVTLAACDTVGVADALTRSGVPNVVAMQAPLQDDLVVPFARNFYASLMQRQPVEAALAQTRVTLRGTGAGWGVATLYSSATDGTLIASSGKVSDFTVPMLRNRHFVCHGPVLEEMHRELTSPDAPPLVLLGMGGLGKTQIAAEFAHRYRASFPGGIFWVKAKSNKSILEEFTRIGHICSIPQDDKSSYSYADAVRLELQKRTELTLLIYDNVTWENEANPKQATEPKLFLPVTGECRILITSRHRLIAPPHARIFDDETIALDLSSAMQLFAWGLTLNPEDQKTAEHIVGLMDRLPLALALARHYIARCHCGYQTYHEHLKRSPIETMARSRIGFESSTGHSGMIFNAIGLSYFALAAKTRQLLAILACFDRQSIPYDLALQASGHASELDFNEALAELTDCSLLLREKEGRLTLHELVRVFVLGEQTMEALGVFAASVASTLNDQLRRANQLMDWQRMRREMPHCRAVIEVCSRANATEPQISLLHTYAEYLLEHREFSAAEECCDVGIRLTEDVEKWSLLHAHFWRLRGEAQITTNTDAVPAALSYVQQALEIACATLPENDPELWHFYNSKGLVLKLSGNEDAALPCYQAALEFCRQSEVEETESKGLIIHNIAALLEKKGEFEQALHNYRTALEIYSAKYGPAHSKLAVRLNGIGRVLFALAQYQEAFEYHSRAFQIHSKTFPAKDINVLMSMYYQSLCLKRLARLAEAQSTYDEAMIGLTKFFGEEHPFYIELLDKWRKNDPSAGETTDAPS